MHSPLYKMDLQYFAEEVDGTTEEAKDENKDALDTNNEKEKTFTRDELAKMVKAQVASKEKEIKSKYDSLLQESVDEAVKLTKMSAQERAEAEQKKKEETLSKREKELSRREIRITTAEVLEANNLSNKFIDLVMADTAEEVNQKITSLKEVFNAAVEDAVNARLAQKTTKVGTGGKAMTREDIMKVKDRKERERLISENIAAFKHRG